MLLTKYAFAVPLQFFSGIGPNGNAEYLQDP
jgi:hypothetical protein